MLHLPDHLYRDVGVFIDTGQLILLVVIAPCGDHWAVLGEALE
jgi:hypothetical protein